MLPSRLTSATPSSKFIIPTMQVLYGSSPQRELGIVSTGTEPGGGLPGAGGPLSVASGERLARLQDQFLQGQLPLHKLLSLATLSDHS
jgi:hypothetical protein